MKPFSRWWGYILAATFVILAGAIARPSQALSTLSTPCDPLDQWATFVIDPTRPTRAVFIDAADLDGDHLPDLVTGAWWYENPGAPSGAWTRHVIGAPLAQMAALWDFDGDADIDLLGTATSNPAKPWLGAAFVYAENDGQGGFTIHEHLDAGGGDFLQGVAVGRFRGTATEVILSWHNGAVTQSLTVPADPATGRWTIRDFSTTTQKEDLSAGKIDADNDLDLLLGTKWLENNGAASGWPVHTLTATAASPDRNELALINADSLLDAVIGYEAISAPGLLAWYEHPAGGADGAWVQHSISTVTGPMSLDVEDMDNDGDNDVVVGEHNLAAPATARMLVFENADGGGGSWVSHLVGEGYEHHDGAQTADLDLDGDFDIFSIGWGHNKVLVYENQGCGGSLSDGTLAVSSTSAGTVAGLAFADEDILAYDLAGSDWRLLFDGSDVGLAAADVDAFDMAADGALLLSFDAPVASLSGLTGPVDDSDIVAFRGALGPTTSGSFSWVMDGSDVDLATDGEDIDALSLLPDGRLLISTVGAAKVGALAAADEDLLVFTPTGLGATTTGRWAFFFDGSDVGLTTDAEDLSGLWVDPAGEHLYLTLAGAFSVPGARGDDDDVLVCRLLGSGPQSACDFSAGVVWNGGDDGLAAEKLDGLWLDLATRAAGR